MRNTPILVTLLTLNLFFGACSSDNKTQEANDLLATNEIVLTALDKKQYIVKKTDKGLELQDAKGKVVIYDIFATWCPPCQAEASHLASLQKKYKNRLTVLGISVENNLSDEKLKTFQKQFHADYALINSSENRRLIDEVVKELHLGRNFGLPLMVLYKDGKVLNYYQGATEEEFIESDIKKALGK